MSTKPSTEQKRLTILPRFPETLPRPALAVRPRDRVIDDGWDDSDVEDVVSSAPAPTRGGRARYLRTVQPALRPSGGLGHGTPSDGVAVQPLASPAEAARVEAPPRTRDDVATVMSMPALHIVRDGDDAAFHQAEQEAAVIAPELAVIPPERALVLVRPSRALEETPTPAGAYADYEALGMAPPKAPSGWFGKMIVSSYRMLGFTILTLIVVMIVGYITEQIFYYASHSWVTPTIVSPSDEKIVALRTELAAQQNQRDKIVADLDESERAIAAEGAFQTDFAAAIKADLAGRKVALGRVKALVGAAYSTRQEILSTNKDYAGVSSERMKSELAAGLIDRNGALASNYQLAQISSANLSLAEREAELDGQATDLANQAKALDSLLASSQTGTVALSYDVLKIKHDYDTSKLALAKANETRLMLKRSLARQDAIIAGLQQSAYLRALDDHATVALVPYENLDHVSKDTALYGCRVGMIGCHQVGKVLAVLPGEVQFKHPKRDRQERGQLVEIELADPGAAQDTVLFLGGAPLGL